MSSGTKASFGTVDYILFASVMALSALVGVYFAFIAKKRPNSALQYLMGGKTVGVVPVSMSLIASYISGITLLGVPAEMYSYGTQFSVVLIAVVLGAVGSVVFFIPVYHKLKLTTSYEYLSLRFDSKVRLLGSILYTINTLLTIPIIIYVPGIAFSQVSGMNLHLVTTIVCLVCIFYTSLGGLKAVVWTDAFQTVMMFGSMLIVVIIGTVKIGGPAIIWKRNADMDRIEFFNLEPDPTVRHTFWNMIFGSLFMWLTSLSVNQGMVQRFLAMPTMRKSQIMVVIFCFGATFILSTSCYAGLLIFATYHDCDLVSAKIVRAADQILPHFVMDVSENLPGLPGFFMGGVFSAALSSMSTGLNSLSGVVYQDFIGPFLPKKPSDKTVSVIMKITCALIGIFCTSMVFIVEKLGAVIQLSASVTAIGSGPLLGIFILGMFFPQSNSKGALVGGLTALLVMAWIVFGAQAAIAAGLIPILRKPMSYDGCDEYLPNFTSIATTPAMDLNLFNNNEYDETTATMEEPLAIYKLSYRYYPLLGLLIVLIVGMGTSFATGATKLTDIQPDLLTPMIRTLYFGKKSNSTSPESEPLKNGSRVGAVETEREIKPLSSNSPNQSGSAV